MRREERVTVQGPVKKQQPDGMSHEGVLPPRTPPPPETKVSIVGKNEVYHWENLVGPFLLYNFLAPRTPPPPLSSNAHLPRTSIDKSRAHQTQQRAGGQGAKG